MIRIFETGDLHIGKMYSKKEKHPQGKMLSENRVDVLQQMVDEANREQCDLFAITGDMFDKRDGVGKKKIARVAEILSGFAGKVLVLPGNHDYYASDDTSEVWKVFLEAADKHENIDVLNRFEPYEIEVGDDEVVVYPAYCHTDHATKNNLDWIKECDMPVDGTYRIGMAHGAVDGYTIDEEGKYFFMTKEELNDIPVDVWLIGHTHVMFPNDLTFERKEGGKIFNAGTHVQTSSNNNTEGNCFILELEKNAEHKTVVYAKRFISGNVWFKSVDIHVTPDGSGNELRTALQTAVAGFAEKTSVSVTISGTITRTEYEQRNAIYEECLGRFLEYEYPKDSQLMELITEDFVKSEFPEVTFPAQLLMQLLDDPKKAQLAYDLLKSNDCKV